MSKILIVEDEEAIADLERDYLELSGFTVEVATDGDIGLLYFIVLYEGSISYQTSGDIFASQNILLHFYLHLKPIPNTPYRLDILRVGCIYFYFLTDFLDMHRYRCDIPDGLHIPDLPE